ncbi:MAG: dehypoxanthine futalosine cyclase, partial [Verrucomicrobiae bacterium]|nr:dehypoxanthine futalosine cyclase [Verrucomicrobiae bacterium]
MVTVLDAPGLESIEAKVLDGGRIGIEEGLELYRGLPLTRLGLLADERRRRQKALAYGGRGNEVVTYIIDRNVNYTNICNVYFMFNDLSPTEKDADAYVLSHEEIDRKLDELVAVGGTQVLMQGGHHPKLGMDYYLDLLSHLRSKYPQVNLHAFSPPEFNHF